MTEIIGRGKAFKRSVRERMAKTGEPYTVARARMLAGAAADPQASIARNLTVPKGRRVEAKDIAVHARPLHPPCNGKGWVKRSGLAVPCRCTTKRFLEAHPEIIMDDSGIAWWPAVPDVPEALRVRTPEELAQVPRLTQASIEKAIEEGQRMMRISRGQG